LVDTLSVQDLGRVRYADALTLQDQLVEKRLREEIPDSLLLLEHPPVITLGRRGSLADVFASAAELQAEGIEIYQATRGGLVTYHGPGQLVGYPIVALRPRRLTIPCYVRALENAIIDSLAAFGIAAYLREAHVGVFCDRGKIAAIGIAQRHGITLHGFAVNLQPDLHHFDLINPCGIGELGVTSAAAILGHDIDLGAFKSRIAEAVERRLGEQTCRSA